MIEMNTQPSEDSNQQRKSPELLDMEQAAADLQPVTLDHVTIKVADLERSSRFYQDVLGMPLLRAEPDTHYLGLGNSFMGIQSSGSDRAIIDHFNLGLMNFDARGIVARLAQKGISIEGPAGADSVRFVDPDGLHIQLSSTDYARKQTYRDESPADQARSVPDLQPVTLDHVTIKVADLERSSRFYQDVLGMPLLRRELDTHYLGLGNSFMSIQPSGSDRATIDHFSLGLMNFDARGIVARLAQKGISIEGPAGVDSVRFVDPDGLHIQLSSTDYSRKQTL
jgi:catechol 2,3-dioxygenase-like lactoylglutathione lyase family enzyme